MCTKLHRGDVVKIWSLQSFSDGGFLNGVEGVVRQDQTVHQDQTGASILVIVPRNYKGDMILDTSYEVYDRQLEFIRRSPGMDVMVDNILALNRRIRTYEFDRVVDSRPWNWAPEFYFDENMGIQLDRSMLEYPEALI